MCHNPWGMRLIQSRWLIVFLSTYSNHILHKSNGIEEMGLPSWQLSLTLLLAWIIVALVLLKGVQSLGKVSRDNLQRSRHSWTCGPSGWLNLPKIARPPTLRLNPVKDSKISAEFVYWIKPQRQLKTGLYDLQQVRTYAVIFSQISLCFTTQFLN